MGWDMVDTRLQGRALRRRCREVVREHIREDVDALPRRARPRPRSDIRHWVAHTGGPKVLQAIEEALELPPGALARSWASLREVGNLSSASVLFVLGDLLDAGEARPGDWAC